MMLVMKYIKELEVQKIVKILGLGTGAVKMRLLRARELFRNKYKEAL
jgi:DNA-directed RNA polymerase specialized sigma24 family protein